MFQKNKKPDFARMGNLDFVYLLSPFSDANSRRFYRRDFGHNKQVNSGDYDKSAHNFSAWFHSQLATNLNFSSSSFRSMLYRRPSCSGCSATYSISFEQQQLKITVTSAAAAAYCQLNVVWPANWNTARWTAELIRMQTHASCISQLSRKAEI